MFHDIFVCRSDTLDNLVFIESPHEHQTGRLANWSLRRISDNFGGEAWRRETRTLSERTGLRRVQGAKKEERAKNETRYCMFHDQTFRNIQHDIQALDTLAFSQTPH